MPQTETMFPRPDLRSAARTAAFATSGSSALPAAGEVPGVTYVDQDLLFLLRRATNGFTVADYHEAAARGYDGWLEWQLDHHNIDDAEVDAQLATYQTLDRSNGELVDGDYPIDAIIYELQQALLLRGIYSKKQLFERMVEFWTDHFSINQLDEFVPFFKTSDDREVIRAHALGNFRDMLRASARSPAMLYYLDNYANVRGNIQENYARELMELHTLGADGPFTEQDVTEVARCFTGWGIAGLSTLFGTHYEFKFVPTSHDVGAKTVLGHDIAAGGGKSDGNFVLNLLAMHPKTAEFISTKMARWLLSTEPPAQVVRNVTHVYLTTGGDIQSMVREILSPASRALVPAGTRRKFRRPYHLLTALMRATGIQSANLLSLTSELERMSMVPYWRAAPDGYPDDVKAWGRSLLPRWTFASRLMGRDVLGNEPVIGDIQALLATAPAGSSPSAAIDWILTGGTLAQRDVDAVQAFIDGEPSLTGTVLREAIALAASSPSYQYY